MNIAFWYHEVRQDSHLPIVSRSSQGSTKVSPDGMPANDDTASRGKHSNRATSAPVKRRQGIREGSPPRSGVSSAQSPKAGGQAMRPGSAVEQLNDRLTAMENALKAGQAKAEELRERRDRNAAARWQGEQVRAWQPSSPPRSRQPSPSRPPIGIHPSRAPGSRQPHPSGHQYSYSNGRPPSRGGQMRVPSSPSPEAYELQHTPSEEVVSVMNRRPPSTQPDHQHLNLDMAMIPSPAAQARHETQHRGQPGSSKHLYSLPVEIPIASQALGYAARPVPLFHCQ